MRTLSLVVYILISSIGLAIPASADDTAVEKVTSRYVLADFGIEASDKPGNVIDLVHSWNGLGGQLTIDWWNRLAFDGRPYGTTFGSEHDFTGTGDWTVETGFCKELELEGSAAYYELAPFDSTKNDVVELYVEAGCAFHVDGVTITPAIRSMQVIGVTNMPDNTLVRFRVPFTGSVPFLQNVNFVVEPSMTFNLNAHPGQHENTFRPSAGLTWNATDTLTLQGSVQATNHTKPELDLGLNYRF